MRGVSFLDGGIDMSFNFVVTVTSLAGLLLGIGWMFAGTKLFKRWGIDAHVDGVLVGRRLGAVYLGVSIFLFMGRTAPPSDLRTSICVGLLFSMVVLAGLGIFEFIARRANALILVSVALEVILAIGFMNVLLLS
jgi:hypothetical protein